MTARELEVLALIAAGKTNVYLLNRGEVSFAGDPGELEGEDVFQQYVGADVGH